VQYFTKEKVYSLIDSQNFRDLLWCLSFKRYFF